MLASRAAMPDFDAMFGGPHHQPSGGRSDGDIAERFGLIVALPEARCGRYSASDVANRPDFKKESVASTERASDVKFG